MNDIIVVDERALAAAASERLSANGIGAAEIIPSCGRQSRKPEPMGAANAMDSGGGRDPEKSGARRKKRERHRCSARRALPQRRDRQGESNRDQAQRRSGGAAPGGMQAVPHRVQSATIARSNPQFPRPVPPPPCLLRRRRRRRGLSPRPRSGRCAASGSRKSANSPADGRWAIRRARTSPIAGSRRRRATPIAPAIAGLLISRRRRERGPAAMRGDGRTHPAAEEGFAPAPGAAAANQRAMARSERKAHVAATGRTPELGPFAALQGRSDERGERARKRA